MRCSTDVVKLEVSNQMDQIYKTLGIIFGSSLVTAGCGIVPGMHMNTMKLTPTPTGDNKVVMPGITTINASLILQQKQQYLQELEHEKESYRIPQGFYTEKSNYQYYIGRGDVIKVIRYDISQITADSFGSNSAGGQDLNSGYEFTVDRLGDIYYPYLGKIHVLNKSIEEVRLALTKRLEAQLNDPQLNIDVIKFNGSKINVIGAVTTPSTIPLTTNPMTIIEAVNRAGIISCAATEQICSDIQHVKLTQGGESQVVNLKTLKSVTSRSTNWVLEPGAVIDIPDTSAYEVYVLGGVTQPGTYRMYQDRMTLRQAMGKASGAQSVSDPKYTYIVRNYQNKPEVYVLNMKSPDSFNLAGDFELKPQDVIFVSRSKLQSFNDVLNQITPSMTTYVLAKSVD